MIEVPVSRQMQPIVSVRPYRFIPPNRRALWPFLLRPFLLHHFIGGAGITTLEFNGSERLRASLGAGHGIVIASNHCRPADPWVLAALGRDAGCHLYLMTSWHAFAQNWLQRFVLPRAGAFSVYREGTDRESLHCAIDLLVEGDRPLVLFPEGVISRHNDRVNPFLDGLGLMARRAAHRRAVAGKGAVVIHPVGIRYVYEGDAETAVRPMLEELERRLDLHPGPSAAAIPRLEEICDIILTHREIEYFGDAQGGPMAQRAPALIERILRPLERTWLDADADGTVVTRVKRLRAALLPDLVARRLGPVESRDRWKSLRDAYLAQQISLYPPHYLAGDPPPERVIEFAEKLEEDTTDRVRRIVPFRVVVDVGDAIVVAPKRGERDERESLGDVVRTRIAAMLAASLARHRPGATLA